MRWFVGNVMARAREQELLDAELMRVRMNLAKEAAIVDRFEWEAKSKKIEAICTPIMLVLASPFFALLVIFVLDMTLAANPTCDNALRDVPYHFCALHKFPQFYTHMALGQSLCTNIESNSPSNWPNVVSNSTRFSKYALVGDPRGNSLPPKRCVRRSLIN